MNVIYNKHNGEIDKVIQDDQDYLIFYQFYPDGFIDNLSCLHLDELPSNWKYCIVKDNMLILRKDNEVQELKKYGKILTEEERLEILLQPTREEIAKAETTLEILSTLQEVGLI